MSGLEHVDSAPRREPVPLRLALLAALGVFTIATPYLGRLVGLSVDVDAIVEVVDHVIPGLVVLVASAVALRSQAGELAQIGAIGFAFLAGFWVTATHVPLLAEADRGESAWDAAIWHTAGGVLVAAVAGWMLVGPLLRARA